MLEQGPVTARAYLTKHVEKIVMDPEGGVYVASGSWNLLGNDTLGAERTLGVCRGAELNCLRRPFQGRALPVSYPGTVGIQNSSGAELRCRDRIRSLSQSSTASQLGSDEELLQRFVEFPHPVFFLKHFARLGAVGGTNDAVLFHDVDQPRRASITDAQAAL